MYNDIGYINLHLLILNNNHQHISKYFLLIHLLFSLYYYRIINNLYRLHILRTMKCSRDIDIRIYTFSQDKYNYFIHYHSGLRKNHCD